MSLATRIGPMMGKKAGRPKTGSDNVGVKINRALKSQAEAIADFEGNDTSDVLNRLLEAPLAAAYLDMLARAKATAARKPKGGE